MASLNSAAKKLKKENINFLVKPQTRFKGLKGEQKTFFVQDPDGNAIEFKTFKNGIVTVELRGSCSGCPSSILTLKQGVQNLLCHYIPEVKSVEAKILGEGKDVGYIKLKSFNE
mgnify:CR=1 FL=1